MKAACLVLLSAIIAPELFAQVVMPMPHKVRTTPEVAEKLLIYKAELTCPRVAMPARVTGTVVVAILIGKNGEVLHPEVISGPAMLRRPVLDAVRKYKYRPYLLNNTAVEVETTVSVAVDTYRDCPIH